MGLLDEWAARFFEELDYVREGNNGIIFAKQMEKDLPQVLNRVINDSLSPYKYIITVITVLDIITIFAVVVGNAASH